MAAVIDNFRAHIKRIMAYDHALGVLGYEQETIMPRAATAHLGNTLEVLSEERYKLFVDPRLRDMLEELSASADGLDEVARAEIRVMTKDLKMVSSIPMDEYVRYEVARTEAGAAWRTAKETDDYDLFEPHLNKLVGFNQRIAGYIAPEKKPYDALIDQYEEGMTMEILEPFFHAVRQELVPLIQAVTDSPYQPDDSCLKQAYPIQNQAKLSEYLMDVLTMDRKRRVIGTTEHPFTTAFTKNDVRITTHYHQDMMESSMYSVIHEGGHALYELNIADDLAETVVGCGASMGIHESQSRFFENIIGRSEPFIHSIYPKLRELFPDQLRGVDAHTFYLAINRSRPSLIRTEADELTYSLHIMVRYELEKQLIAGTLSTRDLPAAWNEMYRAYLGVDVPSNREGVLQDSHWSFGGFGYFPSYALGSAYGAQMLCSMQHDLNVWECVAKGDLTPIVGWLTERIYRFGCGKTPLQLFDNCCHAPFDPTYYTDYLRKKFTEIYRL